MMSDLYPCEEPIPVEDALGCPDGFSEYVEVPEIKHYENIRGGEDE